MGEKSEFVPVHVKWALDLIPQGEIIYIPDKKLKIYKVSQAEIERLEEFWRKNRMGDYARGYLNGHKRDKKVVYADDFWKDEDEEMMEADLAAHPEKDYVKTSKGRARAARRKRYAAINKENLGKPEERRKGKEVGEEVVGI